MGLEASIMKQFNRLSVTLLALTIVVPAFGDDQQKAEKQLHKITAMATDGTGRRVVSRTVADALGVKRSDLVMERRTMNLNYGDLFLAHALVKSGAKMEEIATQLKGKKSMGDIANAQPADWKQIAGDAKKLNSKVEDNLYKHFVSDKADLARDQADQYDPAFDGVSADNDVSKEELADAENTYQMWRDRAAKNNGQGLDTVTEKAARDARGDPIGKAPNNDSKTTGPN
jgi:hypothetical protein